MVSATGDVISYQNQTWISNFYPSITNTLETNGISATYNNSNFAIRDDY